jgi:hypothetical protein
MPVKKRNIFLSVMCAPVPSVRGAAQVHEPRACARFFTLVATRAGMAQLCACPPSLLRLVGVLLARAHVRKLLLLGHLAARRLLRKAQRAHAQAAMRMMGACDALSVVGHTDAPATHAPSWRAPALQHPVTHAHARARQRHTHQEAHLRTRARQPRQPKRGARAASTAAAAHLASGAREACLELALRRCLGGALQLALLRLLHAWQRQRSAKRHNSSTSCQQRAARAFAAPRVSYSVSGCLVDMVAAVWREV